MLKIQEFLLDRHPVIATHQQDSAKLSALAEPPYSLHVRRHPEWPNLVQFTYNQIESPKADPIVREARGLILDQSQDWKVVAHPFNRFYNYGEPCADEIDWSTARVQEKVDGTLIIMYHYNGKWQIATKGSPDAGGNVGDMTFKKNGKIVPMNFRDLFWHSIEYWLKGLSKSGEFHPNDTYMWELTSPWNRVVCDYTEIGPLGWCVDGNDEKVYLDWSDDKTGYAHDGSRVTLIGVRDNTTGKELPTSIWQNDVHYVVKEFPMTSVQTVLYAAEKLNPLKQEGFVVVDGQFNRVKIKSPQYVIIHHLRDGSPRKRIAELIKSGESAEVMAYKILDEWPAEKRMYEEMSKIIDQIILTSEEKYAKIKDITNQKDFALEAVKDPLSGALFALRKGKVSSIRSFVMNLPTDKLLELIDKEGKA